MNIIRLAEKSKDYESVWEIFSLVIQSGDTYVFDPETPKEKLLDYWFATYMDTFVLVDESDRVIATYIIKPNQIDLGDHIANCGYMVHPDFQGKGFGSKLCEHSINIAKQKGYSAIQFNIVVSTNKVAVKLWEKFGFEIIGTTPQAFRHKKLGFVDSYIMYKNLNS